MARRSTSVVLFVAIGLLLYALVYAAAEWLMYRTAHSNPFYKIQTATEAPIDWVILGASHAMPLDFADFNTLMERQTGLRILNLAAPGAGPLYNRFVFDAFQRRHRAAGLLYVADSFAFYAPTWNEERFADAKLLRRTPIEPANALILFDYVRREAVDPRAFLDYVSGFSKINNRERFERDVWEGEAQFERAYRTSGSAIAKRIAYLYPEQTAQAALERYLGTLDAIIALARETNMRVVVVKMPVPAQFRAKLPDEAAFDAALARALAARGVALRDFSQAIDEPRLYFDTDHLNRLGLTQFFERDLKPLLLSPGG
jgi:hypothetical protein